MEICDVPFKGKGVRVCTDVDEVKELTRLFDAQSREALALAAEVMRGGWQTPAPPHAATRCDSAESSAKSEDPRGLKRVLRHPRGSKGA